MGNRVRRLYYCTISFSYSYAGSAFRVFFAVSASLTSQTLSSEHSTRALEKHSAGRNVGLAFPHHRQTTGEKAGSRDGGCASCPLAIRWLRYMLHTHVFHLQLGDFRARLHSEPEASRLGLAIGRITVVYETSALSLLQKVVSRSLGKKDQRTEIFRCGDIWAVLCSLLLWQGRLLQGTPSVQAQFNSSFPCTGTAGASLDLLWCKWKQKVAYHLSDILCINYRRKSPAFRNNRNNLSLSENCNCKHNTTICQLFQMERSRLREGSSLFDHILIGKCLHYRFGFWTLLPLITLQAFFASCLSKEYLCLTLFKVPPELWRES